VNESQIKFFARIDLCPKFKISDNHYARRDESTFQQQKHDPNKIMKLEKEEWD
jgi:hypothetical protein